jgi:thiol-disulfide isomerase/thioredoxin
MRWLYPTWRTALALLGIATLLYYTALSGRLTRENNATAPDFSLPDLAGRTVSLSSFKGRVVLLDFWATWCEPCQEELPELVALHEKYKDRGFSVVGVSMDILGLKVVAPFARENRVPYPLLLSGGMAPEGYPLPGFPAAFLIDRRGLIVRRYLGPKLSSDLARDIEEVLAH